jgi:hypothetical protein
MLAKEHMLITVFVSLIGEVLWKKLRHKKWPTLGELVFLFNFYFIYFFFFFKDLQYPFYFNYSFCCTEDGSKCWLDFYLLFLCKEKLIKKKFFLNKIMNYFFFYEIKFYIKLYKSQRFYLNFYEVLLIHIGNSLPV